MYALDLVLPFSHDLEGVTKRDCDLKLLHQFRLPADEIDRQVAAWLQEIGITIGHAEVFHTPPKALLPIHVDGPEMNSNIAKLNFCYGAEGSKMLWWKLRAGIEPTQLVTGIGTRYLTAAAKDCITVKSHRIAKPTLVNVGIPHSVFNMTNESRWVLSLVLHDKKTNEPLKMDRAVELLKHASA